MTTNRSNRGNRNYGEFLELMEKYNGAKVEHIKNNIYDILKERHLKHSILESILNVSSHTARSYINQSIKSKPSIENILKICIDLDIEIDDLIVENNRQLGNQGRGTKKWDKESMQEFIEDFENKDILEIAKKYELAEGTCIEYARLFERKLKRMGD